MEIIKTNQLNKKQVVEVNQMVQACLQADHLERSPYLLNDFNYYEYMDCFYLLYEKKKLLSFLTIFQPIEKEAEITAYTLPDERRKGYFTLLLESAIKELKHFQITDILFVIEPASKSGIFAASVIGNYKKSEYLLQLNIRDWKMNPINTALQVSKIEKENIEKAAYLSSDIFDTNLEDNLLIFDEILKSDQMVSYGTFLEKELIGICNVNYGENNSCIFGLGIKPIHQGKGYGKEMLQLCLQQLASEGRKTISIQIGSENKKAFVLYRKTGFEIKTQYDYYQYKK